MKLIVKQKEKVVLICTYVLMEDGPVFVCFVSFKMCQDSTWNARAQRHEGDGCDGILESHRAAKGRGDVANDGSQDADQYNGYDEAKPPIHTIYR